MQQGLGRRRLEAAAIPGADNRHTDCLTKLGLGQRVAGQAGRADGGFGNPQVVKLPDYSAAAVPAQHPAGKRLTQHLSHPQHLIGSSELEDID